MFFRTLLLLLNGGPRSIVSGEEESDEAIAAAHLENVFENYSDAYCGDFRPQYLEHCSTSSSATCGTLNGSGNITAVANLTSDGCRT